MNDQQALKILIVAAKIRRHKYAFDAKLFEQGINGSHFENDHKRYSQLTEAIAWAEQKLQEVKGD